MATTFKIALVLSLFVMSVVAPIPPCSPLIFINRLVESPEKAWLFRGLPGHPVDPCAFENPREAPLEQQSLKVFFSRPGRIQQELKNEIEFWISKGIPRLNARLKGFREEI